MASETANPTRENLLLSESRSEYLSQEGLNREFSVKAAAMCSLNVIVLASMVSVASRNTGLVIDWLMAGLIASTALTVALASLVVRPSNWKRPVDLPCVKEWMSEHESGSMIVGIAEGYMRSVSDNRSILDRKAGLIKWMSFSMAASVSLFIAATLIYLVFPQAAASVSVAAMGAG